MFPKNNINLKCISYPVGIYTRFYILRVGGVLKSVAIMRSKLIHKYVLLFLTLPLCLPLVGKSIYYTKNKDEADKAVYITKYRYEADEAVTLSKYKNEADSASIWHITTNKEEANEIIYLVSNRNEADKVIFICDEE